MTISPASPAHQPLREPQQFRDLLPYRLVSLASIAGAPVTRWCEGEFGISRRQWRVMATLSQEGPMQSAQLADKLDLDRARTSRALSELEDKAIVQRSRGVSNARFVHVQLTGKGQALVTQLWPKIRAHHLRLLEAFNDEECQQLQQLLTKLKLQAKAINDGYGSLPKANRRAGQASAHQNHTK